MGLGYPTRAFSPRSQLLLLLGGRASSQGGGVGCSQALCGASGVVGPPPLSLAGQLPLCVVASWCLDAGGGGQMGRGQAGREERGWIQTPPLPRKGGETLGKEPALLSLSFRHSVLGDVGTYSQESVCLRKPSTRGHLGRHHQSRETRQWGFRGRATRLPGVNHPLRGRVRLHHSPTE